MTNEHPSFLALMDLEMALGETRKEEKFCSLSQIAGAIHEVLKKDDTNKLIEELQNYGNL